MEPKFNNKRIESRELFQLDVAMMTIVLPF
jgi:hypothetical protein